MIKIICLTLFFSLIFLGACSDLQSKKGKKGDFSFRKYTNCNVTD